MAEKKNTEIEEVKDYSKMKRDELLAIAKGMGAKVNTKTKKADLIAAIEAIEKEEVAEEVVETVEEEAPAEEATEAVEEETTEEEAPEEEAAEAAEEEKAESEPAEDRPLTSTERKRKLKAERREAKAARKEANRVEEKKKRPSNLLLAILIFGVLIGMFAFIGGYNYFSKPASIEAYMEEQGMADMYTSMPYDDHSTITVRAEDNTVKILLKVDEDISDEDLKEYTSDDATKEFKQIAANFITSMKPEVRGFGGTVKFGVKKGDETVNYIKLSYSEAKKVMKELEKEAEEAEDVADDAEDAAEDVAEDAEEATEEAND